MIMATIGGGMTPTSMRSPMVAPAVSTLAARHRPLATRIAADHGTEVTGVDPARPVLDIARQKPGVGGIRWTQA